MLTGSSASPRERFRSTVGCLFFLVVAAGGGLTAPARGAPLPRVLIIGDSISIGYTTDVKVLLEGVADVQHNPGNAAHTWKGLEQLNAWLGDGRWDVIHFNWGLHDLRYDKGGRPPRSESATLADKRISTGAE